MRSVYIRPLHFVYGSDAKDQLKKKIALPICGNTSIAFAAIEIFNKKTNTKQTLTVSLFFQHHCRKPYLFFVKKSELFFFHFLKLGR